MTANPEKVTPEEILAAWSPTNRQLGERLRSLIREVVPDAVEAGHPIWRLIGYHHGRYFGFVGLKDGRVVLGFEFGSTLPDPEGVLDGGESQVRHVTIRNDQDLDRPAVRELIRVAASRALMS